MKHDIDFGIVGQDVVLGGLHLGPSDVGGVEQDLSLQVGQFDDVEVNDADLAHAGQGQVDRGWGTQATGPMISALDSIILRCPALPTSCMMMWRL